MIPDIKIDPALLRRRSSDSGSSSSEGSVPENSDYIFFSMLRAPALRLADGQVVPLGRKDAALLVVLAMDGSCARDALALMLWPDAGLDHARSSLRQRRFRLAHRLGSKVIEGEHTLQLAAQVDYVARDPDLYLRQDLAALDGDLLEGYSFDDCPDFSAWLELAGERWRTSRAEALARLASHFEARMELASAVEAAKRLAAAQELSDHAHRRLMRLHYLRGDLGAAMEVYRNFASRLAQELGEFPDVETEELALKFRLGEAQPRAVAPVLPTVALPPRLVGRDAHWAVLEQVWAQRASLVIEAAPGMGKSRLIHDFVAGLGPTQVQLLQGLPLEADRPFGLLVRLLQRLSVDGGALWAAGAAALGEWGRHGNVQIAEFVLLHIRRAVALGLINSDLALIVIDDVHHVDHASLELLLALEGPGLPRLWLTSPPGELPSPLAAWRLQAGASSVCLQIQPWNALEITELLNDLALPALQGPALAQALWRYTGGVPRFVLETLRSLCIPGADLTCLAVPPGVLASVRQSKARLPEAVRQLAAMAALCPKPLAPEQAAAALACSPQACVRALEQLAALQWFDAQCRLHPVVATALRHDMSPVEKQWLQGQMAGAGARTSHQAGTAPPAASAAG